VQNLGLEVSERVERRESLVLHPWLVEHLLGEKLETNLGESLLQEDGEE
jgi:hypothetical protein